MSEYLVIVESPAKSKTIGKYLGKKYTVEASVGHIRDLPKSTLGVNIEKDFEPKYITIRGKAEVINKLKKLAKSAKKVLLATDPDREGEAISWHLATLLNIDENEACRVTFNEITKNTVLKSIKEPRPIDMDLVNAQQARRILDRIVGYKISPILWANVRKGLSAGRVQSVATRIICDREEEIENFVAKEYWNITAKLAKNEKGAAAFSAKFYGGIDGSKIELENEEQVNGILNDIKDKDFVVKSIKETQKKKAPSAPFTTSTLQQEASRKLGFSTKKTMMIAQQLYEGVDIKDHGTMGLITYIRTDSVRISEEAVAECRDVILNKYGSEYLHPSSRIYSTKSAAQNAHEAIRPTNANLIPAEIKDSLSTDQFKLYRLIWERFIACQMSNAIFDSVSSDIAIDKYIFRATGTKINFPGYMKVYSEGKDNVEEEEENKILPPLSEGELLINKGIEPKQMFTQPPSRYTEASLVKALEEKGIGRPSTYAPTISTIISRGYVEKDKKLLYPTELGKIVNELMKKNFSEIVDVKFTANMESMLDNIENGTTEWVREIRNFYEGFSETVKKAEDNMEKVEIKDEVSDIPCENCGRLMVYKNGKFGKFLACPGFPECRNTKNIVEDAGVSCPQCGKPLVYRKTKKMKKYLACSGYPECKYINWDMPAENMQCEVCGSFMVRHFAGGGRSYVKCGNHDCRTNNKEDKEE